MPGRTRPRIRRRRRLPHGGQRRGVERDQALRAVTEGVDACPHYRPDTELGVLDRERPARPEGREGDRAGLCGNPPRLTPVPHAHTGHSGGHGRMAVAQIVVHPPLAE
ncbi:DUF6233 domain-containing protein [Streptomyces sp. NPDC056656]|uniref:DUF6233 domain-containing protein n=1 Tax=Streptomyces sp. NPDC056656 TaxID=3345895 RepID=UPI00367B8933